MGTKPPISFLLALLQMAAAGNFSYADFATTLGL